MQDDLAGEIQLTGIFPSHLRFYSCCSDHLLLWKEPPGLVLVSRDLVPDWFRNFLALLPGGDKSGRMPALWPVPPRQGED